MNKNKPTKKLKHVVSFEEAEKRLFSKADIERMAKRFPEVKEEWRKEIQEELAGKIKSARKDSYLTQEELAEMLNVTRSNVVSLESGSRNVTLETLNKVARVMGKEVNITID